MYKKYITNKTSYTKMRKNNLTSTNPPLPPPPDKAKYNNNSNTHTFIQQSKQPTKLLCMYKYIYTS